MKSNRSSSRARKPTHPGAILREDVFPSLDMKKQDIARMLGISRQTLNNILEQRASVTPAMILEQRASVTPAMAVRLGKFLGNGPSLWLNLQQKYDLWEAENEIDVSRIPTVKAA